MATDITTSIPPVAAICPPQDRPNYDLLVTEDDKPVDSFYSERQHQLLTSTLSDSWKGPGEGCPCFITTDVGLFISPNEPPFAPDVLLSLGVSPPKADLSLKENRSYYIWKYGKAPDALVEVVSNKEGGELTTKLKGYARLGAIYYIVWDPFQYLGEKKLHCFALERGKYVLCEPWFPELELGVKIWVGAFAQTQGTFLRWCDRQGNLIPTGTERADEMKKHADEMKKHADETKKHADETKKYADETKKYADEMKKRADQLELNADDEKNRADKLAEKLRAMGIDPDQP